jgi:hypothetical protein
VCPTGSGQIRLWAGICALFVPAFLLAPGSRWTLLAPVGTLAGMSAHPPFDPERELQRLQRVLASQEPAELRRAYLSRFEEGRLVWPGTTVPHLGVIPAAQTASGLIVPASAVTGPAPIDAMATYLTSTEVLGRPLTDGELVQWLKAATDEHFIMEAAIWLARLEHHGSLDVDFQLEAAGNMFAEPARTKVQNLIRNGARLLAPQVLLGVMKAALLVSPAGVPARADNKGPNPFVFAMLGVADRLGVQANDNGGSWGSYPADLSLEVARNQSFNVDHNFGSLLARYQRLWHDLPRQLAGEPDAVDVEEVFEQITGVTLDDLLLVGAPATGAAERSQVRFERSYFYDNIPLPKAKLDAVFRLLATDKATMQTLVRQESQTSGFDWSYTAFRQFPMLHADNGDLILLSPVFLQERLTGGAAYWTLHDHFLSRGGAVDRFRSFHGRVVEHYARESVERMVPEVPGGARRVWCEEDMQRAWSPKRAKVSVCDIAIDYGWAWVCIEVVSGRLTQKSLAGGTAADFDQDVAKLIEKKVKQLDATIQHLDRDEEKLTGRPRTPGAEDLPGGPGGARLPREPDHDGRAPRAGRPGRPPPGSPRWSAGDRRPGRAGAGRGAARGRRRLARYAARRQADRQPLPDGAQPVPVLRTTGPPDPARPPGSPGSRGHGADRGQVQPAQPEPQGPGVPLIRHDSSDSIRAAAQR